MNYSERIDRYMAEWPIISGGKGDQTVKAGEQAQGGFNTTLMNAFTTQFGKTSSIFSDITSRMQNNLANPQGFGAPGLTALRTGATENAAKATANAQQATNLGIAAKGGSALPSGVNAQLTAQNNVAGAALDANSQNQISIEDQQLKNENYWKSAVELNTVAGMENPTGYAGAANQGGDTLANESGAFNASNQSQLLGALGGAVGGIAGAVGTYYGGKKG